MSSKTQVINAATIGLGFGLNHAKVFTKNKYTKLISISDCDIKKKKYEKIFKTNFVKNLNEVYKNKSLNLISIASYDNFHYEQIIQALRNGKNIFIEKPMCQNIKQFKNIKKILKESKLNLSSNFVLRYHPKFKKVKELIDKRIIGKIYSIEGEYNYGRIEKLIKGWRGKIPFYSVVQGGGIHLIDLMIWITGSTPIEAISVGNKIITKKSPFKFNDNNIAILKFKNDVIAKVTSNFSCVLPHHHTLKVFGSRGTIEVNKNEILLFKSRKENSKAIKINYKKDIDYKHKLLDTFILSLVKNKKNDNPSKEDIFFSLLACFAIDKSLKSRKWEKIKT